jgi:predicted RNase H-like HicB family nuclease
MHTYTVVVHEDPEGGFWAEAPALPGCDSQGDTIDELKSNIREAIVGVVEVLREQGLEPDPNIRILDVKLHAGITWRLESLAIRTRRPTRPNPSHWCLKRNLPAGFRAVSDA